MRSAVIVDAVRTPSGRGKPGGALSGVHPVDLLAAPLRALVQRTGIDPASIEDVVAGCVSQAREQAGNIARFAALAAGLPESVAGTTLTRACGSSQQAVHFAAQGVIAGAYDVVIAAGVESMSRVPMGTAGAGADMTGVALAERYPDGFVSQGIAAERLTLAAGLSRDDLDEYAASSHHRAHAAAEAGHFDAEIVPVGDVRVDETVRPGTTAEGLGSLAGAFRADPTGAGQDDLRWDITAGNSSPLTDASSAVLIMSEEAAARAGLRPLARFVSFAVAGDDPVAMLTAPVPATRRALERAGLTMDDVDTCEVNEAFASVPLFWARELGVDREKVNPDGGAIALGHAIGASGTRLLTTMVHRLQRTGGRYGLQTICEHGGMANALVIERLP